MKIGIVGVGKVGGTLATLLVRQGHDVTVTDSRGGDSLADAAAETGADAGTLQQTTSSADVVVIAVPFGAISSLPTDLLANARPNVAVVDAGHYWPTRDGYIEEIEEGLPESAWTQRQLGHPVVKAFNGSKPSDLVDLARPAGAPDRLALPVAGDDEAAKAVIRALIDELGLDSADAGAWSNPGVRSRGTRCSLFRQMSRGSRCPVARYDEPAGRPSGDCRRESSSMGA